MLEDIESKMEELSKKIEYEFKDISLLKKAMNSTKIQGKKRTFKPMLSNCWRRSFKITYIRPFIL